MAAQPPQEPRRPAAAGAVSRRAVLAGAAAAVLAACSGHSHPTAGTSSAAPSTGPGPAGSPSATASGPASGSASAVALPAATPWRPGPGEIQPDVKLRAVELVEALGAWPPGGGGTADARARVSALGLDPALVGQAGGLTGSAGQAALQVVDAQYGGILTDSASVLVVCRQWTANPPDPAVTAGGTTVDVRLDRAAPRWTVTALHPAQPGPPAQPSATAQRVLADPRIQLPPAAVADLRSGAVHDSVTTAMLELAGRYSFAVSVVRSGHPLDVFGTTRPSDHPKGRAFDVWQIDGHAVVDPATPHDLVDAFMRAAAAAGSYNVGGPRQLTGGAPGQFFSDDTHHDHVHVGFLT